MLKITRRARLCRQLWKAFIRVWKPDFSSTSGSCSSRSWGCTSSLTWPASRWPSRSPGCRQSSWWLETGWPRWSRCGRAASTRRRWGRPSSSSWRPRPGKCQMWIIYTAAGRDCSQTWALLVFLNFFHKKKWFFAFFWLGVGFLNRTGAEIDC